MGTIAAVGPCDTYCVCPSIVVTSIFPSKPIGVPSIISMNPITRQLGNKTRVQLLTKKYQKFPIVLVVLAANAFMIPAIAAIPVAAVMNWNSMITNNWVR